MERTQKAEAIKVIRDRFDRMSSAVFLDFTGMTVEEAANDAADRINALIASR